MSITCRSVVEVGIVQVRVTFSPFREACRSDGGLGRSSDGGCGGPIVAHAVNSSGTHQGSESQTLEHLMRRKNRVSSRAEQARIEAVTNIVPSAKADSGFSSSGHPAVPCQALTSRRCAAGTWFVPPFPNLSESSRQLFHCFAKHLCVAVHIFGFGLRAHQRHVVKRR